MLYTKTMYIMGQKTIWMKAQKDVIIALEISARRVEKKFPGLAQGYREMALQNAEAMLRVATFYRNPIELTLVEDGSYKMYEEFNEKGEKPEKHVGFRLFWGSYGVCNCIPAGTWNKMR